MLIPQNTDIINGYGTIPLVATTTPKNTLTITTSNSQDWSNFVTNPTNPLVSSVASSGTNTPGTSLLTSASSQSLVFSMQASYSSVTSYTTAAQSITNSWGMMIMMNPAITLGAQTLAITESSASQLTPTVVTVNSASSYNLYTMITLTGTTTTALQTSFLIAPAKTNFGIYPFIVTPFSSIYADANNTDIMIATVDGINGPQNKMIFNGYFLINSFTQTASTLGTINFGYINYKSSTALDGSQVPTLLRIKGTISSASTVDSLIIFFDNSLTPFYSNMYSG